MKTVKHAVCCEVICVDDAVNEEPSDEEKREKSFGDEAITAAKPPRMRWKLHFGLCVVCLTVFHWRFFKLIITNPPNLIDDGSAQVPHPQLT